MSKSEMNIKKGEYPAPLSTFGANVPSPLFFKTDMVLSNMFDTAKSWSPSLSRSAATMELGNSPTA